MREVSTYRSDQVAHLLSMTHFEFDGFLKDRDIYDHAYSVEDLDRDLADLESRRAQGLLPKRTLVVADTKPRSRLPEQD